MFTATEKLAYTNRELRSRLAVYKRPVADGKMSERQATREIAIMGAIVDYYSEVVKRESPELELE